MITPAQYWHDPFNRTAFITGSTYLADINNERDEKNESYRSNLVKLENMVLVKWTDDTTIIPNTSPHFGWYLPG